jgi:hypothetical protein
VTVRTAGPTCILGEEGILESLESAGYSSGLQVGLKCAAIQYAQSNGLTRFVMGRSLARLSDAVLVNKLRWGPEIQPAGRSLLPEWTFVVAGNHSPWCAYLNQQGLIAFAGGRPCVVSIGAPTGEQRHVAAKPGRMLIAGPGGGSRIEELEP